MKKLLIVILCISLIVFVWTQYRHFYRVDNMTFTVWKRLGGYCYITPYRYWGISSPKENYIKLRNIGQVYIYINKDSTLLIFNNNYYDSYTNDVECQLENYPYKQFTPVTPIPGIAGDGSWELMRINYEKSLPYIEIDVRHMIVEIGKDKGTD